MALTRDELTNIGQDTILANDPTLEPSFQVGQDLNIKLAMISPIMSTVSRQIQSLLSQIYPYSSSGTYLLKHVNSYNMPLFEGATATHITFSLYTNNEEDASPIDYTIPANTQLKDSVTGILFYTVKDIVITSGQLIKSIQGICYSALSGKKTYSGFNNLLFSPVIPIGAISITGGKPVTIVAGQDMPSDSDISRKLIEWGAYRQGGGSLDDWKAWVQEADPINITGCVTLPPQANTIYLIAWGGSRDQDINIDLSFPVSNIVDSKIIDEVYFYINASKRPEGSAFVLYSASTYGISATTENLWNTGLLNPNVTIVVLLQDGLDLSTIIQGTNGNTRTVTEWIQRQVRYSILATQQFGTKKNNLYYILGSDIIDTLKTSLGLNGYLCSILLDISVRYSDVNITTPIGDIIVPSAGQYEDPLSTPPSILCFYDIDSSFINVVTE